jgi:uncharacterized protein (DUF697 family)
MSDAQSPAAKPRRRRLYQEMTEEPGVNPTTAQAAPATPLEGEFIAAAEPVRIETAPTAMPPVPVAPKPLHASPMLCRLKAKQAVRDHVLLSGSAMVIPVPLLDMAAEAAIQVRMVKRLAEIYGVDFGEERAKTLVVAAIGGFSAGWAAGNLLRYASFATYFTNFWPAAILSAAITYAIGQVFIHHFDKGGGLHDLSATAAANILKEKAMKLRRKKPSMEATTA